MRLELTRRTDYAIRAALMLARNPGVRLSSSQISRSTLIPLRFTRQVMTDLLRADLVSAAVGRAGGYTLRAHPEGVSVLDIVKAVEGDPRRQRCSLRAGPCRRNEPCEVHFVFADAQEAFIAQLEAFSLSELAARQSSVAIPAVNGASPRTRQPARDAAG
ncbi:MAG TPA: Rrf2 family transcriptional regulator [Candidatus Limnocylindrales bacterium]|jgi:Rrf2 family protein